MRVGKELKCGSAFSKLQHISTLQGDLLIAPCSATTIQQGPRIFFIQTETTLISEWSLPQRRSVAKVKLVFHKGTLSNLEMERLFQEHLNQTFQ